jgi:hypothetical protein
MGTRNMTQLALAGWIGGMAILLGGTSGLTYVLTANGSGDAGPVIGPGAADKVMYALEVGPWIVLAAVSVVWICVRMLRRHADGSGF